LAATDMGRKLGAVPLWGGGAGSPSNTMWPRPIAHPLKDSTPPNQALLTM